ncbi:MAG: hypothetical protein ACM3QS_02560 [Bacteroidota bacterium]
MTAPTAAMSSIYSSRVPERSHLLRKTVLLFLLVAALALGLVILFQKKPDYPFLLQHALATVSIAVVAGVASRLVLRRRHVLIRFLAGLAAFLVGLYILGFASGWKYGVGPLVFWPRTIDWDALAQVGMGLYLFLLIFRSWGRPDRQVIEVVPPSAGPELRDLGPNPVPMRKRVTPRAHAASNTRKRAQLSLGGGLAPAEPSVRVRRSSRSARKRQNGAIKTLSAADLPIRPKPRRRGRARPRLQFAVVEDHRCPFCLESVSRADPRGVVECEICHALHHKDCWDVTGICQVPHLNG